MTLHRRDSFVTHRAFCDALAEESARAITSTANNNNPLLPSHPSPAASISHNPHNINLQTQFNPKNNNHQIFPLKKEQHQSFNLIRPELPPWLGPPNNNLSSSSSSIFSQSEDLSLHETPSPNPSLGPTLSGYQPAPSPHMSATALLQKAAQMGATMSGTSGSSSMAMIRPHHQGHVSADPAGTGNFGLNLSSREDLIMTASTSTTTTTTGTTTTGTTTTTTTTGLFGHGLLAPPFGNKAAVLSSSSSGGGGGAVNAPSSLLHDVMMNSFSSASGFEGTPFEDPFGGILVNNSKKDDDENLLLHDSLSKTTTTATRLGRGAVGDGGGGGGGGNEGLTRDFLGLRPLSHSDILSIAGMGNCMNGQQNQSQKSWQG